MQKTIKKSGQKSLIILIIWCSLQGSSYCQNNTIPERNQFKIPDKTYKIPFVWQGDSINNNWEPYAALLIPVKIKNYPGKFYMQFDLGSPLTFFYKNKLEEILSHVSKQSKSYRLENFELKMGKMSTVFEKIIEKKFDSTTPNNEEENKLVIIGTIGTDIIDGKTIIIDYPKKDITISNEINKKIKSKIILHDFIYSQRSILFPAKINNKILMLFFDTGSSMFEFISDKETCQQISKSDTKLNVYKVKSWDKWLTAKSMEAKDSIEIGATKLPLHFTTYIEGASDSQIEMMLKMGIGGLIGNKLFLKYKLIIDTKNKKFGLVL